MAIVALHLRSSKLTKDPLHSSSECSGVSPTTHEYVYARWWCTARCLKTCCVAQHMALVGIKECQLQGI